MEEINLKQEVFAYFPNQINEIIQSLNKICLGGMNVSQVQDMNKIINTLNSPISIQNLKKAKKEGDK